MSESANVLKSNMNLHVHVMLIFVVMLINPWMCILHHSNHLLVYFHLSGREWFWSSLHLSYWQSVFVRGLVAILMDPGFCLKYHRLVRFTGLKLDKKK